MEQIAKLKELIASAEADAEKFFNRGNNAAGTRLRKTYQEIKVMAQRGRIEVAALKNKESK